MLSPEWEERWMLAEELGFFALSQVYLRLPG
jgi:hypothetical protein